MADMTDLFDRLEAPHPDALWRDIRDQMPTTLVTSISEQAIENIQYMCPWQIEVFFRNTRYSTPKTRTPDH